MKIEQFDIWIADLNPRIGTETGKIRPVIVLQSNLLNSINHPSTIVCPITTNVIKEAEILRLFIPDEYSGLDKDSDIIIDQIRAIDNKRLIKKVGQLPENLRPKLKENIQIIFDLH